MALTGASTNWNALVDLPLLEDYVERFALLGPVGELPDEVIAFEYRVRHLWGDRPGHDNYLRRFAARGEAFVTVLSKMDEELARSTSNERQQSTVGHRLGRFQLLELLGRGGMGAVYKALHTKLDCEVAVKVLRTELTDQPEAVARFEREMRAVGGLSHPNLVRALDADEIENTHVLVMGTLDYIAPEQTLDPHNVDARADIYSLGCTFYKLLCGEAPFGGADYDSVGKKILAHTRQKPAPISDRRSEVPSELEAVLDRMLAKEPEERFATAAEVASALEPLIEGHDLSALLDSIFVSPQAKTRSKDAGNDTQPHLTSAFTRTRSKPSPVLRTLPEVAKRRWKPIAGATLLLALIGIVTAWQIVIRVKRGDRVATVEVPEGSNAKVAADGTVEVTLPTPQDIQSPAPKARGRQCVGANLLATLRCRVYARQPHTDHMLGVQGAIDPVHRRRIKRARGHVQWKLVRHRSGG